MSFWNNLEKPFFVLAPMADVTDIAFRTLITKYSAHKRADGTVGAPDVMWTEFVSADGLARANEKGKKQLMVDLRYGEGEHPIVAQLFSAVPEHMEAAARLCRELGFDGIDINMGCPDRSIEKQGCGSAMIKNPESAVAVVAAARRGAEGLPVSVKTRLGYNTDMLEEWLPKLLETGPAAVTLHARTRKEMSKVPAQWERIKDAVAIRDSFEEKHGGPHTLILGNGDVKNLSDAKAKARISGADGVMLGRAIFGNPWLFHPTKDATNVSVEERLIVMVEHTKTFEEMLPEKHFAIMKKHYKAYVEGFSGARELRGRLMEATDAEEVALVTKQFIHDSSAEVLKSSATL